MKYFIDIEANALNEIIEFGCVDENGRTFKSYIKPQHKIDKFIEKLTGISNEMVEYSRDIDEVFTLFFSWVTNRYDKAEFYCYGDCDINFVLKALKQCKQMSSQLILSLIASNLQNYQHKVKKYFKVNQSIGLVKLISYYRNTDIYQSHDALEDAMWLKEVYEHISSETLKGCPFPSYKKENINKSEETGEKYFCQYKKRNVKIEVKTDEYTTYGFKSCGSAADWLIDKKFKEQKEIIDRNRICNRINSATLNKKKYFGWEWSRKENDENV